MADTTQCETTYNDRVAAALAALNDVLSNPNSTQAQRADAIDAHAAECTAAYDAYVVCIGGSGQ